MRIVFMGTPDYAAGALQALVEAGHQITAVVTQPDRPRGRGKELAFSPVKEYALSQGIEVFQPVRIKQPESVEALKRYEADVYVVAAFGQILSAQILGMPRLGCLNIHASLLPRYRGAAPIPWAILNGDEKTGITIMQMDEGVDTGDILMQKELPIGEDETADSLYDKLTHLGAEMIVEALVLLEEGRLTPVRQKEEDATHVGKLHKDFGRIKWQEAADVIARKVRGLNSWPSAYTFFRGRRLKIWEASALSEASAQNTEQIQCGMIVGVEKDAFYVRTGDGVLKITSVQPEGKKRMHVKEFLLGYPVVQGEILGKEEEK